MYEYLDNCKIFTYQERRCMCIVCHVRQTLLYDEVSDSEFFNIYEGLRVPYKRKEGHARHDEVSCHILSSHLPTDLPFICRLLCTLYHSLLPSTLYHSSLPSTLYHSSLPSTLSNIHSPYARRPYRLQSTLYSNCSSIAHFYHPLSLYYSTH